MTHNRLTELYLKETASRGVTGADLLALAAPELDLAQTSYLGRALSRPVFIGHAEQERVVSDLRNLYSALLALPDRLFGGDLEAFARAVGLTDRQAAAARMAAGTPPTRFARADMYLEAGSFRLLEINVGSSIGGGDHALLLRAMLKHPVLAEFVRTHSLGYIDTLGELADTIFAETGITPGDGSLVAAVMWPQTAPRYSGMLTTSGNELARHGLNFVPCHLGDLSVRDRRVWLRGQPVDVIYRIFMIEHLLEPDGPELIDPILRAAEEGQVKLFTPMHAECYGTKGGLALLSDEATRPVCTAAELASLDRLLPWTRMLRPGPVTVDGERVELLEYATARRADLVLKATALHGGQGLVAGWITEPDDWDRRLRAGMGGPFVLQRRVRPEPELFPDDGGLRPWVLTWCAYLGRRGNAGFRVRGEPGTETVAVNMLTGAGAMSCLHELAGAVPA